MSAVDQGTGIVSDSETRSFAEVSKGYTTFLDGDILVGKITPCFENGKIGHARLKNKVGVGSTEFHVVRPESGRADARYLLHMLRQPWIRVAGERRMTGSAGQRRVPQEFVADLKVRLPSLDEQRRIAELLDRIDTLRDTRTRALNQLDELSRGIFMEMFVLDGPSHPVASVGDIANRSKGSIRTGPFGSQLLHSEFVDSGVAVLGIDNAVANEFRWGERRYISEDKYWRLSRYRVYPGDVIITIMGTCGRCAVVPAGIPLAINTKYLCCITLDHEKCLPEYLHSYFLMHPVAREYLNRAAKGAIMSGLNMGIIKDMPVCLPSTSDQRQYVARRSEVRRIQEVQQRALGELDALFASLQHRAFRGSCDGGQQLRLPAGRVA